MIRKICVPFSTHLRFTACQRTEYSQLKIVRISEMQEVKTNIETFEHRSVHLLR